MLLVTINLLFFVFIIITGITGTHNGAHNFSIVFVWIVWWFLLIAVLTPISARLWCMMCPLPLPGEWIRRRAVLGKKREVTDPAGGKRKWPKRLRNIWPQTFYFMGIASFSIIITTDPLVTGIFLFGGMIIVSLIVDTLFSGRYFCRYICPIGAFLSIYSMSGVLEVRSRDKKLCRRHVGKECMKGSVAGYACPWLIYPGGNKRNNYCGVCLECMKSCPYDNMTIRTRPPYQDVFVKERHNDEAFKAIIMVNLAALYMIVLQGPYSWLRTWARLDAGFFPYVLYLTIFWGSSLLLLPGIFYGFSYLSRRFAGSSKPTKSIFMTFAYALIPFGVFAWIDFSFPLLQVNWAYIPLVVTDPFGLGWDLFSFLPVAMRGFEWHPFLSGTIPFIQSVLLLLGLGISVRAARKLSEEAFDNDERAARRGVLPIVVFLVIISIFYFYVFWG